MDFQKWLLQTGRSERSAKSYSNAISGVMSSWAREADLILNSLMEISSPKIFNKIAKDLSIVDIFVVRNKKGKGMYGAALSAYIQYLSDCSSEELSEDIDAIIKDPEIETTEKATYINTRIGQGKFRKQLIDYWSLCAVTGFSDTRFLVASHIKPWKISDNHERLDSFNGLLLLPNLDKVFDLAFISFKEQGEIMISPEIQCMERLGIDSSMTVHLEDRHQEYMACHREMYLKKLNQNWL